MRQVGADVRDAAGQTDVLPEQCVHRHVAVGHAHEADGATRTHAFRGGEAGVLGADALQDAVGTHPVGEFPDLRDGLLAALGDDVGRAELEGGIA